MKKIIFATLITCATPHLFLFSMEGDSHKDTTPEKDVSLFVPLRHYLREEWLDTLHKNPHMYQVDEQAQKNEITTLVEASSDNEKKEFYQALQENNHDSITRLYFQWLAEKNESSKICYSHSEKNVLVFGRKNAGIWLSQKIMNLGGIEEILEEYIDCIACNDVFCSLNQELNLQGKNRDRLIKYTTTTNKIIFAEKDMIPELAQRIKELALSVRI